MDQIQYNERTKYRLMIDFLQKNPRIKELLEINDPAFHIGASLMLTTIENILKNKYGKAFGLIVTDSPKTVFFK